VTSKGPEVSGVLVRALAETVLRYDVSPATLGEGAADTLAARAPLDVRVPLPVFGRMLRRAAELTGEPSIALICGLDASEAAFDLLAPLVSHVSCLRHAILEIGQFQALAFDGSRMYLTESLGVARLRCEFPRSDESTDRCVAEFQVGGLMRMLRGFGSTRRDLRAACFEHRRPIPGHAYTKIFHGRERFSQRLTGLEFASEVLDRPHLHANPELQSAVHLQAEQRLERLGHPAFIDRLKAYLVAQPKPHLAEMPEVAREFGMSVRSLRRRLVVAGLSYRSLTQQMREERARMLLRNPSLTVQGVAGALGYGDTGAFHRAFRRWTGMSAWEYRHSLPSFPVAETAPR
jgi:AraC-like DNA-binding protein